MKLFNKTVVTSPTHMTIQDVTAETWQSEVLRSDKLVVVDFWHEACGWCRRLDPVYKEVATEYSDKLKFAKFNVLSNDRHTQLAVELGVQGTPTLIFFCEGRPVGELVGYRAKDVLKKEIDDAYAKHRQCLEQSTPLKT